MPKRTADFAMVKEIGLTLPGVDAATAYGGLALKLHGKLMACQAVNRSAEPNSLAVMVDKSDRDELIAAAPDVYYVTDHYAPYNYVLVRLSEVNADVLRDLLGMAHKFVAKKGEEHKRHRRRKS